jgi:hypothetical protein
MERCGGSVLFTQVLENYHQQAVKIPAAAVGIDKKDLSIIFNSIGQAQL